jgi:hypothetical protein
MLAEVGRLELQDRVVEEGLEDRLEEEVVEDRVLEWDILWEVGEVDILVLDKTMTESEVVVAVQSLQKNK